MDGGINTYAYADNSPFAISDPDGLSPIKLIKLCAKGYKTIRAVGFNEAVRIAKRGIGDLKTTRDQAKKIAQASSQGKKPIRDPLHPERGTGNTEGRMPHYHPNPRSGSHIFYSIASALTLANYSSCQECTEETLLSVLDFFNPLSAPKDIIDIIEEL